MSLSTTNWLQNASWDTSTVASATGHPRYQSAWSLFQTTDRNRQPSYDYLSLVTATNTVRDFLTHVAYNDSFVQSFQEINMVDHFSSRFAVVPDEFIMEIDHSNPWHVHHAGLSYCIVARHTPSRPAQDRNFDRADFYVITDVVSSLTTDATEGGHQYDLAFSVTTGLSGNPLTPLPAVSTYGFYPRRGESIHDNVYSEAAANGPTGFRLHTRPEDYDSLSTVIKQPRLWAVRFARFDPNRQDVTASDGLIEKTFIQASPTPLPAWIDSPGWDSGDLAGALSPVSPGALVQPEDEPVFYAAFAPAIDRSSGRKQIRSFSPQRLRFGRIQQDTFTQLRIVATRGFLHRIAPLSRAGRLQVYQRPFHATVRPARNFPRPETRYFEMASRFGQPAGRNIIIQNSLLVIDSQTRQFKDHRFRFSTATDGKIDVELANYLYFLRNTQGRLFRSNNEGMVLEGAFEPVHEPATTPAGDLKLMRAFNHYKEGSIVFFNAAERQVDSKFMIPPVDPITLQPIPRENPLKNVFIPVVAR